MSGDHGEILTEDHMIESQHNTEEDWVQYWVPAGMGDLAVVQGDDVVRAHFRIEFEARCTPRLVVQLFGAGGIRETNAQTIASIPLEPEMLRRVLRIHAAMSGYSVENEP